MTSNRNRFQSSMYDDARSNKPGKWRPPVSTPSCAFCNKSVYPAEEVNAARQKFHKLCLKCTACGTLLNSGSITEREKKIYCPGCYRRQFGPHGVGRGISMTLPSNSDILTSDSNSNQDDIDINSDLTSAHDDQTHSSTSRISSDGGSCRGNFQTISLPYQSEITKRRTTSSVNRSTATGISNDRTLKTMSISGNICFRCSKTVYSAEEVKAAGKSFHKRCYTCAHCKGTISGGRYSEHDGELYDNNCYQRLFGPRGVGFGAGSGILSTGK